MIYALMRWIVRVIARVYLGGLFTVEGVHLVPRSGPLLVCSNHIATVDPPLVPAELPRSDSWSMAKSEYFARERWFTRWVFSHYHAFPVVRHSADRAALKRALQTLAAGHALIVYPEGTRVDEARLRSPEPGAGFLVLRSGAPVLPIALAGTNRVLAKGSWFLKRTRVSVRFGEPFRIADRHPDGRLVRREEAAEAIMIKIAALLPEAYRGEFADYETRLARLQDLYLPVSPVPVSPSLPR